MAERKEINLDIVINTADAARSTREIKQSIKELNDEILKADEGSEAFIRASKKAGELKDKLEDAKDSIKSFNASPIENITNSFGSLGSKLKSLDFGGAKQEFSNLSVSLKEGVTSLGAMIPGLAGASKGMQAFGGAIAATGIGALVIAIVLLITNFDKLKEAGGLIGETFTKLGNIVNDLVQYVKDLTDAWGLTAFAAQDAAKKQIEAQETAAKNAEEWYARNGDKYDEFTKRKIEADIEYKNEKVKLDKDETKSAEEKARILTELQDKRNREIKAADDDRKKQIDKEAAEEKAKNDKIAADKKAANDKTLADTKRLEEDLAKLKLNAIQDDEARALATAKYERDKALEATKSTEQRLIIEQIYQEKLKQIFAKSDNEIKEAEKKAAEEALKTKEENFKKELEKRVEANNREIEEIQRLANEEKRILLQYAESFKTFGETVNSLNQNLNSNLATIVGGFSSGIGNILQLTTELKVGSEQSLQQNINAIAQYAQAALGAVSGVLNGIQQNNQQKLQESLAESQAATEQLIADEQVKLDKGLISQKQFDDNKKTIEFNAKTREYNLKKKAFEDDKKLKIAQTVVSGLQGAVGAFAMAASTIAPPAGLILGGIMAAAIAAMTAVNVSKIQSTKFGEAAPVMPADASAAAGAAGGAMGGGANPTPSPVVNDFTAFGTGGQANNIMANQPVVQAVVVESQITATQLKLAGYKQNAELSDDYTNKG